MFWQKAGIGFGLAILLAPGIANASSGTGGFLTSSELKVQIEEIAAAHPDNVRILDIGQSLDNRHLYVLQIGTGKTSSPAVLALFGQHADEHETTSLALGLTRTLLDRAQRDETLASELDNATVYIAPMVNPDGMDYDLLDSDHRGWRKNRSPQEGWQFGVDLNRNWGAFWDAPTGSYFLSSHVRDPANPNYRGPRAFSEKETQALRNFILSHGSIRTFIDYHTGSAGFMQGAVLVPYSYGGKTVPSAAGLCAGQLPEKFADTISDPGDSRKQFRAVQSGDMKGLVIGQAPLLLKPIIWAVAPGSTAAPGAAIDWTASYGLCSMGVEISLHNAQPDHQEESALIESQSRGLELLLESLVPAQSGREKNGG